jgi:hypothetical protein
MNLSFAGQDTRTFVYYAVSPNRFVLAEMDPDAAVPATASLTFKPVFAFGSGDSQSPNSFTSASVNGVRTVMLRAAPDAGSRFSPQTLNGTFSISGYSASDTASAITLRFNGSIYSKAVKVPGATLSETRAKIVTFDPSTGRATLSFDGGAAKGFVDSAVMYLSAPAEGTFLETTVGAANHALSGSLSKPGYPKFPQP